MGTSHFLGQNFSRPFEVKFADKDNVEHFTWQTSWGISWRLIGAMIMIHGDNQGLVLPPKVAPIQVVIVPIYKNNEGKNKVLPKVEEFEKILETEGIRVYVDDRSELSPGYKFNDWELKGIPIRLEIGPKDIEKQSFVLAKRYNREKTSLNFDKIKEISLVLDEIQDNMLSTAKKQSLEKTLDITRYEEFKSKIEKGGFFKSPWCGRPECEEKIKEETGADVRVIPFDSSNTNEKCIYCKEQSTLIPIFARGY